MREIDGFHVVIDEKTSARLGRIRQKHTKPELAVRQALAKLGFRYRTSNRDLPGSPDAANRVHAWAVFVHGCYWHRHAGCARTTTPTRNREFWEAKFAANVRRDQDARLRLEQAGFLVLTLWECETESPARLGGLLRPLEKRRRHAATKAVTRRARAARRARMSSGSPSGSNAST